MFYLLGLLLCATCTRLSLMLLKARHRHCFKRRCFFAAGVNDIWAMPVDQHDKCGPCFGLWLHNGIDPFIGVNNWLKVWWTSKNPQLIVKYFLDYVWKYGGKHLFSCLVQVEPNLYGLIQQYLLQLRAILGPRTMVLQIYKHLHGMNLIHLLRELFGIGGSETRWMSNQKRTGQCFNMTLPLDMRIYLSLGSMLDIITLTMYLKSECLTLCNYGHFIWDDEFHTWVNQSK